MTRKVWVCTRCRIAGSVGKRRGIGKCPKCPSCGARMVGATTTQ